MFDRRHVIGVGALLVVSCASVPPGGQSEAPVGQWPAVVSGPGTAEVSAVTFIPGGILVAGRSERGATVAAQDVSALPGPFFIALDDVGVPQWARTLETTGLASIDAMAVGPGPAVLFAGSFEGTLVSDEHRLSSQGRDCIVGRMDLEGNLSWLRAYGEAGSETCRSLALGTDGSVWVTGSYTESFDALPPPKGHSDVMVLRIEESSGAVQSAFGFGSTGDDHGHHIELVGDEGLVVAGNFGGPSGEVADAESLALELSDALRLVPAGDHDGFVAQFDVDGAPRWATAVSGPGFDVVTQVMADGEGWLVSGAQQRDAPAETSAGSSVPEGASLGASVPLQGFVARLEADGRLAWTWSDPLMASVTRVVRVRDRIMALGHHRDGFQIGRGRWRVVGQTGITLVVLDEAGEVVGGYGCDSPGDDRGVALATTSDGRIALGGNTSAGGGCARLPGPNAAGFVRLMVLDPQGELRPLVVEH